MDAGRLGGCLLAVLAAHAARARPLLVAAVPFLRRAGARRRDPQSAGTVLRVCATAHSRPADRAAFCRLPARRRDRRGDQRTSASAVWLASALLCRRNDSVVTRGRGRLRLSGTVAVPAPTTGRATEDRGPRP